MKNVVLISILLLGAQQSNAQDNVNSLSDHHLEYMANVEVLAQNNVTNDFTYETVEVENLNHIDPINTKLDWKKVVVLTNDSETVGIKSGEIFRVSYQQNGMSKQRATSLKKNAIEKIRKMAAAKGVPIIKIDNEFNSRLPKSRFKSIDIVGIGYRYQ